VPVPHAVNVPNPYYVRVAQPVQVTVNRPYAVEVPRPVPYPVPQYVRTNIPVLQQQHIATLDATKANPFEGFIENAQSTFQNVIGNLPSLPQNPFENFQNPFQNFELPSFPSLPSFSPQVTQTPAPATGNNVPDATNVDSVAIDNPVLKKTAQSVVTHHHQTQSAYKPATTCAGCSVSSTHITSKHVQPTDNGYNY
ncbi:cuticular protein glycine-rich 12 precursor, partial [Lasius niger]